jgi:hypothetical protein
MTLIAEKGLCDNFYLQIPIIKQMNNPNSIKAIANPISVSIPKILFLNILNIKNISNILL